MRLPPAAWSVCTPPSARQSGAPTEVRQRGLFGHGPAPVPLAWPGPLLSAVRAPSLLPGSPAWAPHARPAAPSETQPFHRQPEPLPCRRRLLPQPHPLHPGLSPEPGAPTHVAATAQLLQRNVHGGVGAGGTLGLPAAGPRPGLGLGSWPPALTAARHQGLCRSPSLRRRRRRPRLPEPPPAAAPRPRWG